MNRTLALIGVGRWGKNLARNFDQIGVLHTVCDPHTTYDGVHNTGDYQEVLQNRAITQVAIAAPAALHFQLAKEALLAGKDLFVEKPLCLDSSEGEELIALAKKHDRILMVGHLLQYHPCFRRLLQLVDGGAIGKMQYIMSNRLNLGTIRTEESALWCLAPHDFSIILSLCGGAMPRSLRCTGEAYLSQNIADLAITTMTFDSGVKAHVFVNWLHPYKEQKLMVIGTEGTLLFDDREPWEKKLQLFHEPVIWQESGSPVANQGSAELVHVPQEEPLKNECLHFLECCKTRQAPLTDGREGLRVLKMLQAAQRSLDSDGEMQHLSDSYTAHPTAVIDAGCTIGTGTKIWHFCHLMKDCAIGENCSLGQNVVVSPGVTLGHNVKVQNNVSIYSGVICEDDVFLGPSMVFTNINNPRSAVTRRDQYETTLIRRGATIGANATILCGIELGAHAFVGAGAVVTKDVPAYALVVGNPARQVGWMSRHGERLDLPLESEEPLEVTCPKTGEAYQLKHNRLTHKELCYV
ncbi:MAG: Gfo/Idh/MocA family oxidoreductase [Chlamydiales bacterium]|nr:Gfo/Idh/MocA family oxidoreductase [Chlamydiia bacterium]MCP5508046.1 Gfo/Idh/MocA family oxidoreductase [Chlamydiales bacterium]